MRVRIDREREERKIATGWFARARIPAYCLFLTIHFSEEERYLIRHAGIGRYVFLSSAHSPGRHRPGRNQETQSSRLRSLFNARFARLRREDPSCRLA